LKTTDFRRGPLLRAGIGFSPSNDSYST